MKKMASYILFLGLAAILLYLSFREVKWSDFVEGLRKADYHWILLSMLFGALSFWVRSMRWRLLIRGSGYQVSKRGAFDAVNVAYITNFAFPRAGEVARCGVLAKTAGIPFETLLGTVVLERAFDTLCLVMITVLVISLQWSVFGLFMEQQLWHPFVTAIHGKVIYLLLIIIAFLLLVLIIVFRKRIQKFSMAAGLFRGLKSGFSMRQKAPFFGYTLVLWMLFWATCWCTIRAFPIAAHLNLLDALFLMVVGSFGWVVPVQGGIGAYHFVVSLALASVYGISQTPSLVFATISHESQTVTMVLFGLFSLVRVGMAKKRTGVVHSSYLPEASSIK